MDMDMDGMSSMDGMSTTFSTSTRTPLYSAAWTPGSTGAYAGTCIFLIVLAVVFRGLLAARHVLERRWLDIHQNRRYVVVAEAAEREHQSSEEGSGESSSEEWRVKRDPDAKSAVLITERGVEEHVRVVKRYTRPTLPWRISVDVPRALIVALTAAVGYLLMLAVMTYNVGYFLSVLAGVFVGELSIGRFYSAEEH